MAHNEWNQQDKWIEKKLKEKVTEKHESTPEKVQWRIKTEEEFIEEYGVRWMENVDWIEYDYMSYLFGRELTENEWENLEIDGQPLICEMITDKPLPENNQKTAIKQPEFEVGEEVWIKGKIIDKIKRKTKRNIIEVRFIDFENDGIIQDFREDQLYKPSYLKINISEIQSLRLENQELKEQIKEILRRPNDTVKSLKSLLKEPQRQQKAAIMTNFEESRDLSEFNNEIENDEEILKGRY
jgi:hypothetical protein